MRSRACSPGSRRRPPAASRWCRWWARRAWARPASSVTSPPPHAPAAPASCGPRRCTAPPACGCRPRSCGCCWSGPSPTRSPTPSASWPKRCSASCRSTRTPAATCPCTGSGWLRASAGCWRGRRAAGRSSSWWTTPTAPTPTRSRSCSRWLRNDPEPGCSWCWRTGTRSSTIAQADALDDHTIGAVVRLQGLRGNDLFELVREVAGGEPSLDLVDAVDRLTGGNPAFVQEALREVDQDDSGPPVAPGGVRSLLERRLRRLDPGGGSDPLHRGRVGRRGRRPARGGAQREHGDDPGGAGRVGGRPAAVRRRRRRLALPDGRGPQRLGRAARSGRGGGRESDRRRGPRAAGGRGQAGAARAHRPPALRVRRDRRRSPAPVGDGGGGRGDGGGDARRGGRLVRAGVGRGRGSGGAGRRVHAARRVPPAHRRPRRRTVRVPRCGGGGSCGGRPGAAGPGCGGVRGVAGRQRRRRRADRRRAGGGTRLTRARGHRGAGRGRGAAGDGVAGGAGDGGAAAGAGDGGAGPGRAGVRRPGHGGRAAGAALAGVGARPAPGPAGVAGRGAAAGGAGRRRRAGAGDP